MLSWLFGSRTLGEHIQNGDFDSALEILDNALQLQPENPELLEAQAKIMVKIGRADEAIETYIQLSRHFADRGFGIHAIALLKQARELTSLPQDIDSLINDIASLAHLDDVAESPLFCKFSRDELVAIVQQLRVISFEPGEILLVQGKPGDSLFVISSGEVRVFAEDEKGWPTQVSKIPAPAFFGEIAVIRGGVRTATVTAASPVAVLELTPEGLESITTKQPHIRQVLTEFADKREAELHRQGLAKGTTQ